MTSTTSGLLYAYDLTAFGGNVILVIEKQIPIHGKRVGYMRISKKAKSDVLRRFFSLTFSRMKLKSRNDKEFISAFRKLLQIRDEKSINLQLDRFVLILNRPEICLQSILHLYEELKFTSEKLMSMRTTTANSALCKFAELILPYEIYDCEETGENTPINTQEKIRYHQTCQWNHTGRSSMIPMQPFKKALKRLF